MQLKQYLWIVCIIFQLSVKAQQADSILQTIQTASDNEKFGVYIKLAELNTNTNPFKAIEFANNALTYKQNNEQEAIAQKLLGTLYYRTGNINKSIECFTTNIELENQLKNEQRKAQSQSALGGAYFAAGKLSDAAYNYLQALRYFEEVQDKNSMVSVYSGLANIYTKQNNFSKALEYNLKAIEIYETSSNEFKKLLGYEQIGNLYLRQRNYSKSFDYYNKALRIYQEMNNNAGEASIRFQLGNTYIQSGEFESAIEQFNAALILSQKLKILPLEAANNNELAKAYEQLGKLELALKHANAAKIIATQSHLKIEQETAYETLARLYNATQKTQHAKTFETLSKNIKDSIYNDSTLKKLVDLQLLYESEKSKQQIQLQEKEQEILANNLLKEKQKKTILLVGFLILLVFFIMILVLYFQNKKKTKILFQRKEELKQLNTVKDRFFSIISHDLRNNLTTMRLYFELASNPDYKPEENSLQELSKQISSSVDNTIELLENLLVWAQTQVNGIKVNLKKISVNTLVKDNIALLSATALQKEIQLTNTTSDDCVLADEDMLNLVLRNLISNAIKFTSNGGKVYVHSQRKENNVLIEITDTGVGISEEAQKQLFTRNLNPSTLGTANEKGTGLGLILCKEFIEKNNGTISIESEEGKGSTFKILLPLAI